MNNFIEIQEFNRKQPYDFGMQQIRKAAVSEEYQVNDVWVQTPPDALPQARRFLFPNQESLQAVQDVYACWKTLAAQAQNQPVEQGKIFTRFLEARTTQQPLTLFVPWGVRPQGTIGREYESVGRIQEVKAILGKFAIPSTLLIMPADIYATEINGINEAESEAYFQAITDTVIKQGMQVKAWSTIRAENRQIYSQIASQLTEQKLSEIMAKTGTLERIFSAAQRRSEKANRQQAAYDYLRERIAEAIIIEETYNPVKVSLAPKNKDNKVDQYLPRLYLVPSRLQLPWLQQ